MAETSTTEYSQQYNLAPQTGTQVTLTLTSGTITIGDHSPATSLTLGTVGGTEGVAQLFTITNGSAYAEGIIQISYGDSTAPSTAECHLNFFLSGNSSAGWGQDTSGSFPNDNDTIVPQASTYSTPFINLPVNQPTGNSPSGIDSLYQVLDLQMVFLVDKQSNGNMLFRGNTPFAAPATNNGPQVVDFDTLHSYMEQQYTAQTGKTDFPAKGSYILRDVCLQSPDSEGGSILMELQSFGGSALSQLKNQAWFPTTAAAPLNAQMCNWSVEPESSPTGDTFDYTCVQNLCTWMNTTHQVPHIYYIHCASGHDRTGIVATSYLLMNRQLSLQKAFICGTTVNKFQLTGPQFFPDPIDIEGTNEGKVDPSRSRLTLIASVYDTTVLNIYNTFNPSTPLSAIPAEALQTTPNAYAYPDYPWEKS